MHDGFFFPFAGWFIGLVATTVVVALAVWLIVRATRRGAGRADEQSAAPTPDVPSTDDALRIARERLARGEIDVEQYRAIVQALTT